MKKLNIILLTLCALMLQEVTAWGYHHEKKNYSQYIINYTDQDRVNYTQEVDLKIKGAQQTFTLSKNESHIFIDSTDKRYHCNATFKTLSYDFQVAPFNEKIILWDLNTESFNVVGVTLLLINPLHCNYTSVKLPADKIRKHHLPYKPQVLTYESIDQFDIFFGGRTACIPCRFTGQGKKVTLESQIQNMTTLELARPYLIQPLVESKPTSGYVLAYSFYNETLRTVISKLSSNFTVLRQIYVDHFVDAMTINERDIYICYKKEFRNYVRKPQSDGQKTWKMRSNTEVFCDVYNKNYLMHQRHLKLNLQLENPSDHYVKEIFLSTTSTGNLCVLVPHISYATKGNKYSLSYFKFNFLNTADPSPIIQYDFDDESGYHLKTKASRFLHIHCRSDW